MILWLQHGVCLGLDRWQQRCKADSIAIVSCLQPLAYMAVHMTGVVMTFLLARVFWESFRAHTFFLLFILCISVWNGAGASLWACFHKGQLCDMQLG